jgi:hypothetical protein
MDSGRIIIDTLIKESGGNPKIAFCPYKREMWDCMKTVYDAAVESNLTVYVVPLPYFIVYDNAIPKDSLPILESIKDVENTAFNQLYDLDIDYIVFHNQYDNKNRLTSIHPDFYTKELKKKAKLVYIPYSPVKGPKRMPGAVNADYVFCVDEEDKVDWLKNNPDKKVFVSGSPKIEYTEKYCKNKKKIIHLAASLTPFLDNPHEAMLRYKSIVEKYDTVIFRPHPLMRDSVRSMRAEYEEEYKEFIKWMSINCIIDYSIYPEKVIAICDKMYADEGSMVELWKATNKPYVIIAFNIHF